MTDEWQAYSHAVIYNHHVDMSGIPKMRVELVRQGNSLKSVIAALHFDTNKVIIAVLEYKPLKYTAEATITIER